MLNLRGTLYEKANKLPINEKSDAVVNRLVLV